MRFSSGDRFVIGPEKAEAELFRRWFTEAEAAQRYDMIWNPPDSRLIFDTRKRFHYLGLKEGKLFLVEEDTE